MVATGLLFKFLIRLDFFQKNRSKRLEHNKCNNMPWQSTQLKIPQKDDIESRTAAKQGQEADDV